ncbi:MAG: ArsA family ATPase, partial [Deltaproteobacteria bacterium]|nr:ArsA family ATPase [Deltaproteobacteria bacterium]
ILHPSAFIPQSFREFLIFGGKGGVGKTTIAAVTALCAAGANPDKRILIISTDPAHSLSDSFVCRIGDEITHIDTEGQLYALETDAEKMLTAFKNEYRISIEEVFERFVSSGIDIKFDRDVLVELIDLSPPGLDEIMALKRMADLAGSYDLFILDTAPTGHLLRLLETPEIALSWLKAFMRLLLKYKGVMSLGRAAERVVELTRDVRRIKETRLLGSLNKLGVPCRRIIVNMVMPLTECNFCLMKRKEEERYLRQMDAAWGKEYAITVFPLLPYPIKGIGRMTEICKLTPSPP